MATVAKVGEGIFNHPDCFQTLTPISLNLRKQRERRAAQRAAEAQDAARGQRNRPAPSRC
ncbi:hypothetical protein EMIHUDRAFT_254799 [Emiliania huxleyi CCMP1516]|uniref:Uncharacterized protein n=2 Tax=Emiliania huxleyi TaxID=2903 RepID=A0A0D3JLB6_EMIH1|nr:hypothetical protein EMIHUDRAFT_254799 [Emiliania huxleyi CCMP1516]EOD24301.1 hypothetical protein EMIHUDRAFT_254799 [Emiliania huxleyi CCMP1516]|eukprot:XP_005776730.1 hypothetical protein EMIHUDRAFT_254799 [Emiliania huxleyi CCMP1516]